MVSAPPTTMALASGAMCFDPALVRAPGAFFFDPTESRLSAEPVSTGGRQAAWFVTGEFGEGVLRHYQRGGMIARLSRSRYLWAGASQTRSFAEFRLMHAMREHGLAVPRPIAAAYWRHGPTYTAAIIVERIAGAVPLACAMDPVSCPKVARAIFDMHEAGFWHADLNAFNILFDGGGQVWLIDFDRGRRCRLTSRRRAANLARLRRSLIKVAGAGGERYWVGLDVAYRRLVMGKPGDEA
ncbi:MAG TPA: 3-deoxy-D-manno-octulosonic acid kinase [Burkholderiaceae bacterium]|nr:3-deoxy-D-manno-octulosonic acid kinase [Burkholderiaceae bacterium]